MTPSTSAVSLESRLPHHALHPTRGHGRHALLACDLQQFVTSVGFPLPGFAGRERLHAGIEQCNRRDTFGRTAQDFECHAAAHRVTRERESWRRFAQHLLGHGAERIERAVVGDRDGGASARALRWHAPRRLRRRPGPAAGRPGVPSPISTARLPERNVARVCRCGSSRARRAPRAAPKSGRGIRRCAASRFRSRVRA